MYSDRSAPGGDPVLDEYGGRDDAIWREEIFSLHHRVKGLLKHRYRYIAENKSVRDANIWLREAGEQFRIGRTVLSAARGEDEIDECADRYADLFRRRVTNQLIKRDIDSAIETVQHELRRLGFPELVCLDGGYDEATRVFARLEDPGWWRRQLKRIARRKLEDFIRGQGAVYKARDIYVSKVTVKRRERQRAANRALLEQLIAENELGQSFTLAELSDLSVSNPANRRTEMMVRCRGMEEFAENDDEDWRAALITITAPSKFHVASVDGRRNPKYNGASARDIQVYLTRLWARARAALKRRGLIYFGIRIVEPHHDGTPHWHVLIFMRRQDRAAILAILRKYALEEDGDEPGAALRRFQVEHVDPAKGSAIGYIAKYIAKNIDGFMVGEDSYGTDAIASAVRVEAWATTNGIRQFQFFGTPSVTVWRELRRLKADGCDSEFLEQLRSAADNADWAAYMELMGGPGIGPADRPVSPMLLVKERPGRYDERIHAIRGLIVKGRPVFVFRHEWSISLAPPLSERRDAPQSPRAPPLDLCQ